MNHNAVSPTSAEGINGNGAHPVVAEPPGVPLHTVLSHFLAAGHGYSPNGALGPLTTAERRSEAFQRRVAAARAQAVQIHPVSYNNGDDEKYADRRASFSKGLKHDPITGLVDQAAYETLRNALRSGVPEHFEQIPLQGVRRLVNPQAGLAFSIEGGDSHAFAIAPAPRFDSDEIAAEIVEDYWMALLRDIHFDDYATDADAATAAAELTGFGSDFKGAKEFVGGQLGVTPKTLFRGLTPGDNIGPYLSQFLMLPVPFGAQGFSQQVVTPKPGIDFVTDWAEYLAVQEGADRNFSAGDFAAQPVYIRNGRDLSQYVHVDVLFQAYFNAGLILLQGSAHPSPVGGGLGSPLDPGNPYLSNLTQDGFGTFGGPYIAATLCEVATRALKAVWYQKWYVHRRLRPEVYAARIHTNKIGDTAFDISPKAMNATVLNRIATHNGQQNGGTQTYLLPLAFPEGSPMHPAYGAGHATVAGACVTVLKALFDEDAKIADTITPQCVSADGSGLKDYTGADAGDLTVGGELNKLASNISLGRNMAGVHWRSDGTESLLLGEQVAIAMLRDHLQMTNERFGGYQFTTFSGQKVVL